MSETMVNGQLKACCQDAANLVVETDRALPVKIGQPAVREVMRRCRVCRCRHFEVVAETGRVVNRAP